MIAKDSHPEYFIFCQYGSRLQGRELVKRGRSGILTESTGLLATDSVLDMLEGLLLYSA